jgi:hypothetical protein
LDEISSLMRISVFTGLAKVGGGSSVEGTVMVEISVGISDIVAMILVVPDSLTCEDKNTQPIEKMSIKTINKVEYLRIHFIVTVQVTKNKGKF